MIMGRMKRMSPYLYVLNPMLSAPNWTSSPSEHKTGQLHCSGILALCVVTVPCVLA